MVVLVQCIVIKIPNEKTAHTDACVRKGSWLCVISKMYQYLGLRCVYCINQDQLGIIKHFPQIVYRNDTSKYMFLLNTSTTHILT